MLGLPEPEFRNGSEYLTLAGNAIGHDHVEGGYPVGGDNKQVLAKLVDVPYLAGAAGVGARQVGSQNCLFNEFRHSRYLL